MKDKTRVTSLQQTENEPNTLDDTLDNVEDGGTQEQCHGRQKEANDEVDGVAQATLPQQEPFTRKRKTHEINNSASASLMKYRIETNQEGRTAS